MKLLPALSTTLCLVAIAFPAHAAPGSPASRALEQPARELLPWNYEGVLPRAPVMAPIAGACPAPAPVERVLLAGDSWAQYMWDDDSHNDVFDKFGHADKRAVSRSLGSDPGPGYTGPEYAISGSEAREWVDTANYPWIANVVAELVGLPAIDTVMLSLGGNDILAAKSGGGWYKDMDLDVPGSEAALFDRILADLETVAQASLAPRPDLRLLVSSYEYPNFNVDPLWCWIYACPKRRDLSRDPDNDLVTDEELNALMVDVETRRVAWTNADGRLDFDHGVGEMHYYYGDESRPPGELPRPGQAPPDYLPFPGGDPLTPTLRENFRAPGGIPADPIHLDYEGYQYKIAVQTETHLFPRFRGPVTATFTSRGGLEDGWTDGVGVGNEAIVVGDDGIRLYYGIASFDTSALPAGAEIAAASLYLLQDTRAGANPFTSGDLGPPVLDVKTGSFGAPEVEPGDATAAADAADAGCFVGSAASEWYAVRVDLAPAALAAVNPDGLTQFRVSFSNVDSGTDTVSFKDGDVEIPAVPEPVETLRFVAEKTPDGTTVTRLVLGSALPHRGAAEVLGTAKPFLDLTFSAPLFSDGFETGDTSRWSATVP
ncbi:MAG: hypothetical protein OES32_12405 [Acidobacteriota bacterium]|nr:hypothetical protein [Acidobacteriota bacterium]